MNLPRTLYVLVIQDINLNVGFDVSFTAAGDVEAEANARALVLSIFHKEHKRWPQRCALYCGSVSTTNLVAEYTEKVTT